MVYKKKFSKGIISDVDPFRSETGDEEKMAAVLDIVAEQGEPYTDPYFPPEDSSLIEEGQNADWPF